MTMNKDRMQHQDDLWLIQRTLAGSDRAFRVLIERHQRLVVAVVRGVVGDHADFDDVVQGTIIRIHRGLPRFRAEARFTSWIYRIARNEALDWTGRHRTETVPLESISEPGHTQQDPETAHWHDLTSRRLNGLMAELDEKQRVVLELRYLGDRSYEEIATIMELPMGTVKNTLFRAKATLKKKVLASRMRLQRVEGL